jgi:hypothetical protein
VSRPAVFRLRYAKKIVMPRSRSGQKYQRRARKGREGMERRTSARRARHMTRRPSPLPHRSNNA